jgi:hypothetical protein
MEIEIVTNANRNIRPKIVYIVSCARRPKGPIEAIMSHAFLALTEKSFGGITGYSDASQFQKAMRDKGCATRLFWRLESQETPSIPHDHKHDTPTKAGATTREVLMAFFIILFGSLAVAALIFVPLFLERTS